MRRLWRTIGLIAILGLMVWALQKGYFGVLFYVVGFYVALYIISLLFRTTALISFITGAGMLIFYPAMALIGLYLLYLVLKIMFTQNFFLGAILLVFGLPVAEAIVFAIAVALGVPLFWMRVTLSEKFSRRNDDVIDVSYTIKDDDEEPQR